MEALRRNIESPQKYGKYIPPAPCIPTYLGYDDTFLSIKIIRDKAYESVSQAKQLAQKLIDKNLGKTTGNIYWFAYKNFQYHADGAEQKILTLSCAWKHRNEGIDCKTYSVVVSSILLAAGIVHFIRKVEQPGVQPGTYTHVYVVVPKNQQNPKAETPLDYFVIDATTHDNREVKFVKKYDLLMQPKFYHIGLSMPVNEAENAMTRAVDNFKKLMGYFKDAGVNPVTLQAIWDEVKNTLQQGKEPKIGFANSKMIVNSKLFEVSVERRLPIFDEIGLPQFGPRGLGLIDPITTAGSIIPTGGFDVVGDLSGLFGNILGGFGDLFSNGFNFSCIGASSSPSEAKANLSKVGNIVQSQLNSLNTNSSETEIGRVFTEIDKLLNFFITHQQFHITQTKDCSREGNQIMVDGGKKMLSDLRATAGSINSTTRTISIANAATLNVPLFPLKVNFKGAVIPMTYLEYVIRRTQTPTTTITATGNKATVPGAGVVQTQNAGFGIVGWILALAAGGFAFNKFVLKNK